MAEPLKNHFGPDVAESVVTDLVAAANRRGVKVAKKLFLADCLDGFEELELTPRAAHIADAMATHLPADRTEAMEIVIESLGPELDESGEMGMAPFRYLPHVTFVRHHGHGDFETAMRAQYELTKRFTSEFSIRAYLEGEHRGATLARLREWTEDPSEHVRRLVSEGSRPRLPWAGQLREFIADPAPVLELLELLRHDESEYVRRSVANNLNDIAKDHPATVVEVCRRWWTDSDHDERRMIRHALRTLIKAGDPDALDVLGYGASSPVRVVGGSITPTDPAIGDKVRIDVELECPADATAGGGALVDLRIHFVKANGSTSPKVFKGAELELEPGERRTITKSVSLKQHSTRTHYPGTHEVGALVNGVAVAIGQFELSA